MTGHIGPLLVAAGHSTTPHGTFNPAAHLAPVIDPIAAQDTALDARYGPGTAASHGTTSGEAGNIDLTPLYIANGWPLPVAQEDFEDLEQVTGAPAWAIATIAALQTSQPASAVGSLITHVTSLTARVNELAAAVSTLEIESGK